MADSSRPQVMKHRPSRVRELLLRELGSIINRELAFDATLVTVRDASLTADFKHVHVHVGVIGEPAEKHRAVAKLELNRTMLQRELAKRVVLKFTPHLHFHLDESAERGTRIMSILDELDLPPALDAYGEVADDADEPALGVLTPTDAAAEEVKAPVDENDEEHESAEEEPARAPRRRSPRR